MFSIFRQSQQHCYITILNCLSYQLKPSRLGEPRNIAKHIICSSYYYELESEALELLEITNFDETDQ